MSRMPLNARGRTATLAEQPLLIGRLLAGPQRRKARRRARRGFGTTCVLGLTLLLCLAFLAFLACQ